MDKEGKPFVIEFKPSYGSTSSSTDKPEPIVYCVHGQAPCADCTDSKKSPLTIRRIQSSHCHRPKYDGVDKRARRKLIIASIMCIIFIIIELIGGVISNSLAIATDAAHLLTDFASFMISLFAIWIAGRRSTRRLSFGWYRAEVIGALVSVLMIWVVTAILVFLAVERIIHREFELNSTAMLITSALAILINVVMGFTLHDHGHSHGGNGNGASTSSSPSAAAAGVDDRIAKHKGQNMNVRAAFIHVLGDALQSTGVFIAAIVIYFKPEWYLADPICTFVFSVIVLITTIRILKDALLVLMEGTPNYLDYTDVMETFLQINGVVRVHNLRIWALTIDKVALSAHLAVDAAADLEDILRIATSTVHGKYELFETTLQIEVYMAEMEDCNQCSNPQG